MVCGLGLGWCFSLSNFNFVVVLHHIKKERRGGGEKGGKAHVWARVR